MYSCCVLIRHDGFAGGAGPLESPRSLLSNPGEGEHAGGIDMLAVSCAVRELFFAKYFVALALKQAKMLSIPSTQNDKNCNSSKNSTNVPLV